LAAHVYDHHVNAESKRLVGLAIAVMVFLMPLVINCSGSASRSDATPSAVADDPREVLQNVLDAVAAHDTEAVWEELSTEAKAQLSHDEVARLTAASQRFGFKASIKDIQDETTTGDRSEVDLTLAIEFRGITLNQRDVTFLVRENGQWKLADHFLQTLEVAIGIGPPPAIPTRTFGPDGCYQGDPLAGVWLPSRLQVLNPCISVDGQVIAVQLPVQGQGDGDLTFDIRVSGASQRLLNEANQRESNGGLHIEVVPADQDRLPVPAVGQHVRVQGPWVTDLVHGQNEIHPAWSLDILP
jgi:hypothetical protein